MTRTTWPLGRSGEIVHEHESKTLRRGFTELQARAVAAEIGLDLDASAFDLDTFRRGMEVELEHGLRDPETNVTNDDPCYHGQDRLGTPQGAPRLLRPARGPGTGGAGTARRRGASAARCR